MENTERFFYVKRGMNEDQLDKLSEKYGINPELLIDIYNHALNYSNKITSLKIIPKLDPNLTIVGVEYNNNYSHVYHTINEFLLMK